MLAAAAAVLLVAAVSATGGELRSWSDTSGTATFRAEYVSSDPGWVNLRREDGGLGKVPLRWLSVADQNYVRQIAGDDERGKRAPSPAVEGNLRSEGFEESVIPETQARVDLPPPSDVDKAVEGFIAYDVGRLGGMEGSRAREEFGRLGVESVGPLIRGLNEAAKIGNSCPIVVLRSKLSCCLSQACDSRLDAMAACNLGCGVPRNAPHYRSVCDLRSQCIARLPASHPVRQQQERVDKLLASNDESAVDLALRSGDKIERQAAVTAAGSMGPRFGKELIAALDDSASAVRQEARAGLVAMAGGIDFGPDEPANDRVRSAAMRKWEEWYEDKVRGAFPPAVWRSSRTQLKNMLKAGDEQSRLAAILVIRYRRFSMVNELLKLFDDSSQAVRREARNALVDLADGEDFGPADFSNTADVETSISNWRLCDERRKRRFRNGIKTDEQIKAEMDSSDDEVRLAAVSTAAARDLQAAEQFVARISDPMPEVRQAARHGLVQLAGGTDFGPSEGAGTAAVAESENRWKQWVSSYVPTKPAKAPGHKRPPASR